MKEKKKCIQQLTRQEKIRLAKETKDPNLLAELAEENDYYIRMMVAINQFTNGATLKKLHKDPIRSVSIEAQRSIEKKLVSTLYQYKEAEYKIFQAIHENDDLLRRISDETLKFLYEERYIPPREWQNLQPIISVLAERRPELSYTTKCLEEGILLGSMLSGAWEHSYDLQIAQLTGKSVDEAIIEEPSSYREKKIDYELSRD